MRTEQQIEAAAAAAAEKANGGKFTDPLFYKPEHRAFWKEVIRTALDAADAASAPKKEPPPVTKGDVQKFSEHCVYIRSVYTFALRLFRDSSEAERAAMEATAGTFFKNMSMVLSEFLVNAVCRITDPAIDAFGNQNFTLEMFANSFPRDSEAFKELDALRQRMNKLGRKVRPARNKLGAHADRFVIQKGEPLETATWAEWDDFWSALRDFIRILNEKMTGQKFDIDAPGMKAEAESLLKALSKGRNA
jgi:hypothetical protein